MLCYDIMSSEVDKIVIFLRQVIEKDKKKLMSAILQTDVPCQPLGGRNADWPIMISCLYSYMKDLAAA